MQKFLSVWLGVLILVLTPMVQAWATHIRAGEITARRISEDGLTWEFTLTVYIDYVGSPVRNPTANFNFGDGNPPKTVPVTNIRQLPEYETEVYTYITRHTYPGPGRYLVWYFEQNRNTTVRNIDNPDFNTFYVETEILIDPGLRSNSTPIPLNPPLEFAAVNQKYIHNPAAFDLDGDSLSYRLIVPRQYIVPSGPLLPVSNYRSPETYGGTREDGSGPTTFTLNPVTGDLIWDSPAQPGEYNVAFEIIEWRFIPQRNTYVQVGYVVRDMQIIVKDDPNRRPILEIPADTCVVAGTFIDKSVRAVDPDGDRISIFAFGGPLTRNFPPDTASFVSPPLQLSPATGRFTWQTQCVHVRNQPYDIVFLAEDRPEGNRSRLSDTKTWRVRVVGPPPTNLAVQSNVSSINLTWDAYTCANAETIEIYRKEGPSNFVPGPCETGVPAYTGFRKIADVPAGQTSFTDDDADLRRGATYCYIIYARFPGPAGGESIASNEVCTRLLLDVPLMTKASVLTTDVAAGSMDVRWSQPAELNQELIPGPYVYELYRAEGQQGQNYSLIYTGLNLADTAYTDSGLNTLDLAYNYKVVFYTGPERAPRDTTDAASSVRLEATTGINQIGLQWTYDVPWNNAGRQHYIYRELEAGGFALIDSVLGQGNVVGYTDVGRFNNEPLVSGREYCYYVTTQGSYLDPLLESPIFNNSQRACAIVTDTIAPCPPILSLDLLDCSDCETVAQNLETRPFVNTLTWNNPGTGENGDCKVPVRYNIYYTPYEEDSLQFLISTTDSIYVHGGIPSLAGCYEITAIDEFGNESARSNRVCKDNCEFYDLPNVFTPNGDGTNEDFQPFCAIPGFIQQVDFQVYNRWGNLVYRSTDNVLIEWNGVSLNGTDLPTGSYYFTAEVTFRRLRRSDERRVFKGWVQILR
jgi:gliding motility-associated-like protein